ncbi:MAG: hypothetical protein IPK10_09865 [Bacteroidetes bacterium]|nr:hypothetical protein [Bacteroidota bacterium]
MLRWEGSAEKEMGVRTPDSYREESGSLESERENERENERESESGVRSALALLPDEERAAGESEFERERDSEERGEMQEDAAVPSHKKHTIFVGGNNGSNDSPNYSEKTIPPIVAFGTSKKILH